MKLFALFVLGAVASGSFVRPASATPFAAAADHVLFAAPGTTVPFQAEDKTQVPGRVLKGGAYSITVVDHLSDRMILKISGTDGKEDTLFLAVPANGRIPKQVSAGPIAVKLGSKAPALRGFAFPNGAVAEFVYPKAEAVAIAKDNSTSIPAIDPASEGRPKASSLSSTDLQEVTLWMLTPTLVGTGQPGISAQRLQVAEASVPPPPSPAPRQPAAATPPPPPPAAQAAEAPDAAPKPRKVAHPIAALPHTASDLPLWALTGMVSLLSALLLSVRRRRVGAY